MNVEASRRPALATLAAFVQSNASRFTPEFQEFVRIPSVSADPKHTQDVKRCAEWLAKQLRGVGLDRVRVLPTRRHPIVFAEWLRARGKPTVLIYGHYDVQPVEPVEDWKSPPFEARIAGGFLHGRGASDDKGQLLAHVKAVETLLKTEGRLPINVKCLFEGEEEIGSPNFAEFLGRHRDALKADAVVMSDTPMLGPDQPALTYSLRGELAVELEVRGPSHDLHSGNFGGAVHNPLQALCEILAHLHDARGRISIPGFYNKVRVWSETEREQMARTGPSNEQILHEVGAPRAWGERGFSNYERLTLRPSLSITGLRGGYGGAGAKAIIPKSAVAKLSFRIVADQDPVEIKRLFARFVASIAPPTVRVFLRTRAQTWPALIDRRHPAMRAAFLAYQSVFGRAPVWLRCGGSIGVVTEFQRLLGIPTVLMGFGTSSDGLHAPDEKFSLRNFYRGIMTSAAFMKNFGRVNVAPQSKGTLKEEETFALHDY